MPFRVHDVPLAHGTLRVGEAGDPDGVPLVLVHGLSSSHACWTRALPWLPPGRRLLAPDLPGFGGSDPLPGAYEEEPVAQALVDGLDALGVTRFDLAGHSLGGLVSTVVADLHGDRVDRLVLCAAAGLDPHRDSRLALVGDAADRFMRLRRRYGPGLAGRPRARALMFGGVVADAAALAPADARLMIACSLGARRTAQALDLAMSADERPRLARLTVPLGAVWGEEDRLIVPAALDQVRAARPEAVVRTVPGAAHVPMIERPSAFGAALTEVLEGLDRKR